MAIPKDGLIRDDAGVVRCWWCGDKEDYVRYHDEEWGRPVVDDQRLFEKICLEGFQSGLSWLTILRKRDAFREAFDDFDFDRVAKFRPARVEVLLRNAAIVRHRKKIESVINNARCARALRDEQGSLARYFWSWEPSAADRPKRTTIDALLAMPKTDTSIAMSKDLKKRGWTFVGPTTAYAFMQAMGLVNDHVEGCSVRRAVEAERRALRRPHR